MKINKTELLQIIKEEAGKLKKVRTLIAEKKQIEKQLVEVFGVSEAEMEDEGVQNFIATKLPFTQNLGLKTDEQKKQATIKWILKHPLGNDYRKLLQTDPIKADKFIDFYTKFPTHRGKIVWDDNRKEWADASDDLSKTTISNIGSKIGGGASSGRQ